MHLKVRTPSRQRRANRFLSRSNRFYRSQEVLLLPVARHPDPAAWSSHPVTFNPDRGRAWTHNPMPGHPCVARASPLPVAIRPNVARPWRNRSRLYPNWWGHLSNQNLSCNGLRRNGASCHRPCDFSCRSRDRGFPRRSQLIPTAPANKKAFSYHSSSPGSFCPSNPALFVETKTRSRYERFADFCRMGAAQMESLCSSTRRLRHRGAEHRPMACEPSGNSSRCCFGAVSAE